MEAFISLEPDEIKKMKEDLQKIIDLEEGDKPTEDDVSNFMQLVEYFRDIAEDIECKVNDILPDNYY